MHQVLQRTRPTPAPATPPTSKLRTLLRSFLAGKRGLVLLAVVGGATLSSQALMGLLRQTPQPAPGRPAAPDGREESAASVAPSSTAAPSSSVAASAGVPPSSAASAASPVPTPRAGRETVAKPRSSLVAAVAADSTAPRPRTAAAASPAVAAASTLDQAAPGWRGPWRSRQNAAAGQGVITDTSAESSSRPLPLAPVASPPVPRSAAVLGGQEGGVSQLGSVTLADLDPFQGVPCSDTTAALPSDRPSEEAWLPGSDASSGLNSAALDPLPVPPIYSESPDQAAGPSSRSLQANRITPCLPKQPAGRN